MQLDSVRALKAELLAASAPRALIDAPRALVARREASPVPVDATLETAPVLTLSAHPTLALGVAPRPAGQYALAIRLQERAGERQLQRIEAIRQQAHGEVEVRYTGRVKKQARPWYQLRQRPLLIGCSIAHARVTAGTLGGFVKPRGTDTLAVLSNNHVLAFENRAKLGDAILQPGDLDGGVDPADQVARLGKFVRLLKSGPNLVDAAYAPLVEGIAADLSRRRGGAKLRGLGPAVENEGIAVTKLGRTTGLTRGRVTAFELDGIIVGFDAGHLVFDNQIEIEGAGDDAFSDDGDSGSLILDADHLAVGLLFAGGDQGGANGKGLTFANPLHTVLEKLKADLVF